MKIPDRTKVYETKRSYYWIEPDGILCNVSKKNPTKHDADETHQLLKEFYVIAGREKRCILIDAKYARPNTAQERREAARLLPELTKAMAVIVHNPLGRMVVNLFIGLEKPSYPMKIFKPGEEEKAREWLRTYL